ncbi:hypothetical protein [Butyrivibrio sp. WCD2001]|uniref:hypothetical protein n=1 Tax=Butyrivibrio sp. WCD2001 TaxID=1280681 RepID=UPI000479AAA5|nr:hypothetical protein [Butyrivibrio sp. WCD2001]
MKNADNPSERMPVPAGILDPYIAAFTRAVNECGAYTVMRLWMAEPYSTLWLWMITEYVFGENWKSAENRDFLPDYLRRHDMWEPNGRDDDGGSRIIDFFSSIHCLISCEPFCILSTEDESADIFRETASLDG